MDGKYSTPEKLASSLFNSVETKVELSLKEVSDMDEIPMQFNRMNIMEIHLNNTYPNIEISEELKQISQKLNINEFKTLKLLGRGMFGKVSLVEHIPTGKYYALKSLSKNKIIKLLQVEHTKSERK